MDDKEKRITMGSAFNNAVRLIQSGVVEVNTKDIGAEVAELAKILFEAVIPEFDAIVDTIPTRSGGTSKPAGGSRSSQSERKDFGPMRGDASEKQIGKIFALVRELTNEGVEFDVPDNIEGISKQDASDLIGRLLAL